MYSEPGDWLTFELNWCALDPRGLSSSVTMSPTSFVWPEQTALSAAATIEPALGGRPAPTL
jgi:hypothetical protein